MRALTIVQTMSLHDGEAVDWWAWEAVDRLKRLATRHAPLRVLPQPQAPYTGN